MNETQNIKNLQKSRGDGVFFWVDSRVKQFEAMFLLSLGVEGWPKLIINTHEVFLSDRFVKKRLDKNDETTYDPQ